MANAPAFVGEWYVTPIDIPLSITRRTLQIQDGNFVITNSNGKSLFELTEKMISLYDKEILYDEVDTPIVSLHKKVCIATKSDQDLMHAVIISIDLCSSRSPSIRQSRRLKLSHMSYSFSSSHALAMAKI